MTDRTSASYRRDFVRGVGLLLPLLRAVVRKEHRPTPVEQMLINGLREEFRAEPRRDRPA